jgi:uncharacterized protein YutE (UPF0331/DUF86 family)
MERILHKLGRIKEYLQLVRSIQDECRQRFPTDPIYRGALLHYLYLLADSCIVLAELVIRDRRLRLPQTYAEAFDILGENHILDPVFANDFARIAGFRNFLAHDYEMVDPELICDAILSRLTDIDRFIDSIEVATIPPPR